MWTFVGLAVCLAGAPLLSAEDLTISQMVHTSWAGRDGAPQDIQALAQTPDGLLWIGSTGGLFTFDGVSFAAFHPLPGDPPLPSNAIASLLVSRSGDLWVEATYAGSAARISKGRLTVYDSIEGHPTQKLNGLQQDSEGIIWAISDSQQIVRLGPDGIWHTVPSPAPHGGFVSGLFFDSAGTRWAIQDSNLYGLTKEGIKFGPTPTHLVDFNRFHEDVDHTLWFPGNHVDSNGRPLPTLLENLSASAVLRGPKDDLWFAPYGAGLLRVPHAGEGAAGPAKSARLLDRYTRKDGLSSAEVKALLRDADGSIWAGGTQGLDRFVQPTLVPVVGGAEYGNWITCTNPQGEVWIGGPDGFVAVIRNGHSKNVYKADGVWKLMCGRTGNVWVQDKQGMIEISEDRVQRVPIPAERSVHISGWTLIAEIELSDRELLVSEAGIDQRDLWVLKNRHWTKLPETVDAGYITGAVRDDSGRIFLGRTDAKISIMQGDSIRSYSTTPSSIGVIATVAEAHHNIFALGLNGIAVYQKDGFRMLSFARPELAYTVSGMVESTDGDVWINGARGIVRIPSSEMRDALAVAGHRIVAEEVHEGDFVGPANFWLPNRSAVRDIHGRLWFGTQIGVVWLDPETLHKPDRLPQLSIRSVRADGIPLTQTGTIPPNVQSLEIRYFGINLKNPERVIYKYRLDGLANGWQEADHHAAANYAHLGPGLYHFEVIASNGDGQWTSPVSTASFRVLPTFYQTWWFAVICGLAGLLLFWLLLRMRLNALIRENSMRAEERADERIRIARDLHDTLLQGVQGLLLSFHVAAQNVPPGGGSKKSLESALESAEKIIIEGRNRVNNLRSEHVTDVELVAALEGLCSDLNHERHVQYSVQRSGVDALLAPQVVDEIFNIAREAVTNAFRHSNASRIDLELVYGKRSFLMSCRDNGRGLDPAAQQHSPVEGHWGFRGMIERAERIGGKFSYASAPGEGTTVEVRVSRYRAYVSSDGFTSFLKGLRRRQA